MKYQIVYPENDRKVVPDKFDTVDDAVSFLYRRYPSRWDEVTAPGDIGAYMNPLTGVIMKIVEAEV
jgi:hypothetical protein